MQQEVLRLVGGQWPDAFYATPKVVWREYLGVISADGFLLYHVYRYHADSNSGKCWPSLSMIARKLHWSWQRVRNARDELEAAGLISVKTGEKGRVAIITMLRPKPLSQGHRSPPEQGEKPLSQGHTPMPQGQRPMPQGHTNNTKEQEYKNNTSSEFLLTLFLDLLGRKPKPHEIKRAKELVQHFPEERVIDVVDWAHTRDKPFGAAVHALEGGYPVGPKPREASIRGSQPLPPTGGPRWLPPVQRPKKGEQ